MGFDDEEEGGEEFEFLQWFFATKHRVVQKKKIKSRMCGKFNRR
jgi:hypothetical protein